MRTKRAPFACHPVATHFRTRRATDIRRTAVREAAYIRRTRFAKGERFVHDFSRRGEDLFMLASIIPNDAQHWTHRPFLRWQLADEAVERSGDLAAVRAWHVCGDLKVGLSRGEWMDQVVKLVREFLPPGIVADIAGHDPETKPAHAHILLAARRLGQTGYGEIDYDLYDCIDNGLRGAWLTWLS